MTLRRHGPASPAWQTRLSLQGIPLSNLHMGGITEHRNVGQEGLPSPTPSSSVPVRWGGGLWSPPREILMTPPGDRATDTGTRGPGEGFCGASGSCERPRLEDMGPQETGPGVKPSVSPWRSVPRPKARPVLAPGSRGTGKPSEVKSVPTYFLFFIVIYSKVAEEPERTGHWSGCWDPLSFQEPLTHHLTHCRRIPRILPSTQCFTSVPL